MQVGGPLGAYLPESQWDMPLDYEAFAAIGAMVGHGGIVVHDDTADMAGLARYAMEFCAHRVLRQVHALPHRLDPRRGGDRQDPRRQQPARSKCILLRDLCDTMVHGSLCAMGGMTPYPGALGAQSFPAGLRPCSARPRGRLKRKAAPCSTI